MAVSTVAQIRACLYATESEAQDRGTPVKLHTVEFIDDLAAGSGASQVVYAWSDDRSVTSGVPDDVDLRGQAQAIGGATMAPSSIVGLLVRNRSTTSGQTLTIGVAGSNPFITCFAASGDGVVIGPGGDFLITSPVDGFGASGTAKTLRITANTSTIAYTIAFVGR